MKKIIFILMIVSGSVYGQKIGFKGGIGTSYISIKESDQYPRFSDGVSGINYSFGLSLNYKINRFLSVEPGLSFNHNSYSYVYENMVSGKNYPLFYDNVYINQIQVPIIAKVSTKRVSLFSGPCMSIHFKNENVIHRKGSSYYGKQNFSNDDIGLYTGIGVLINKKPAINIELRHYNGFLSIDKNGYKQRFVQVGTSIYF